MAGKTGSVAAAYKNGLALAAREHLASGEPLTRMEAIVLYGVANLPDIVKEMRGQGWTIQSRTVTYAAAMSRLNRFAELRPPQNLPIREIHFTEYWVSR
jgi:hypothetical protein